jgi:hypothetical protein
MSNYDKIVKTALEQREELGYNANDSSLPLDEEKEIVLARERYQNGYKLIQKEKAPTGQEFLVVAYMIFDKPNKNGSLGKWFFVRTFSNADKAIEAAQDLIAKTGIGSIYACEVCTWQDIDPQFKPNRIQYVPVDLKHDLIKQHDKDYKKLEQEYEKRQNIQDEIQEEITGESDEDSIHYYTREWFLYSKNQALIEGFEKSIQELKERNAKHRQIIKDHAQKYPEHEDNWLSLLKTRLPKRGEKELLRLLDECHSKYKDEIFKC